jgi:hypothetical protein
MTPVGIRFMAEIKGDTGIVNQNPDSATRRHGRGKGRQKRPVARQGEQDVAGQRQEQAGQDPVRVGRQGLGLNHRSDDKQGRQRPFCRYHRPAAAGFFQVQQHGQQQRSRADLQRPFMGFGLPVGPVNPVAESTVFRPSAREEGAY